MAASGKKNYELEIVISGGTDASLGASIRRARKEISSLERQAGLSSKALSESFFGMDTKTAAANSLYIILFSQATSFATTLITRTVPQFTAITLVLMVFSGILGGAAGRIVNKQMDNQRVEKLFVGLMGLIILASAYNTWQYMMP